MYLMQINACGANIFCICLQGCNPIHYWTYLCRSKSHQTQWYLLQSGHTQDAYVKWGREVAIPTMTAQKQTQTSPDNIEPELLKFWFFYLQKVKGNCSPSQSICPSGSCWFIFCYCQVMSFFDRLTNPPLLPHLLCYVNNRDLVLKVIYTYF